QARARYQRARALLRGGSASAARTELRALLARHPRETEPAADALFLLADLATDEGRDVEARAAFRDLATRYPGARRAPEAAFRAAIIAYVQRNDAAAARELDALRERWPSSGEATAAAYWAGRAYARMGDQVRARAHWRDILARDPNSYYAGRAAARLDTAGWKPPAARDDFPQVAEVTDAFRRADLLDSLGMDVEARLEYDRAVREADASVDRLLATADALRDRGLTSPAIGLGWRAIGKGAPADARTYRLVYPVAQREVIAAEARANRIEPALVAALIRQESSFNPRATSRVGARGLMQLMPSVGTSIARAKGLPDWDPVLLYQPDVNVTLGVSHLRGLISRYRGDLVRVFAAYNAGDSRVTRWNRKAGADDPEVFVERIPYEETRDYVRILLRNREMYEALYEW
ncbi:MAG: transglycosylase SLT domain-containing protein, partial [Gemmatimonadaceae bacterium]